MTKSQFILQILNKKVISFQNLTIDGELAPYYVDFRALSSHSDIFRYAVNSFGSYFKDKKFDHICGVATASLPLIGGITQKFGYSTIYHRPHKKNNGRPENLVEGHFKKGDSVYILDDLTITTDLSIDFIKAVESVGLVVKGYAVVFEKKIPEKCSIPFQNMGYDFFRIFDHDDLAKNILKDSNNKKVADKINAIYHFAKN